MLLYIKKSKNLLEEENENISFDSLVNNNYVINRLKEMLFKLVPDLSNASKKIINICVGLIEFLYNKLIQKNDKLNEGWIDSITSVFNSLYDVINNIFTDEQSEMIVLDKTVLDQNSIEINEFLKENIIEKETMLIDINDIESINKICKFEEIKLFAIKTEKNYICMPLDNTDFKGFKAIATTEYYRSYYDIPDDIYKKFNAKALNFLEFLKNNHDFHENKKYQFENLIVKFEYQEDPSIVRYAGYFSDYAGYFSDYKHEIVITFKDFKEFKKNFTNKVTIFIHEYIHYMDFVRNKDKFTNWDLSKFTNKIFDEYGNTEEIDLKDLQEELEIKDVSAFRYLIGLMQKHKYIDYVTMSNGKNDYTKIKVLIDTRLGSGNIWEKNNQQKRNYYNDAVELNTHINTIINDIINNLNLTDKINQEVNQLHSESYISNNIFNNLFIPFPYSFWEKIDKFIKDTPNISEIAEADILFIDKKEIPKSVKEAINLLKKLKIFKKINFFDLFEYELINYFKKYDKEDSNKNEDSNFLFPITFVKIFIKKVFINKEYESKLQIVKDFKNNNFTKIIENLKDKFSVNSRIDNKVKYYTNLQSDIYKRQLIGKNYDINNFTTLKDKDIQKIENYRSEVKKNYKNIINEQIDLILKKLIVQAKIKFKKDNDFDLDLQDYMINNNENLKELPKKDIKAQAQTKPKKELQKDNLLRQYVSLLIH